MTPAERSQYRTSSDIQPEVDFHEKQAAFHDQQAKRHRERVAELEQLQSDLDGGVLKERHAKYPAKGKSRSLNDIVAEGLMELPSDVTMPQTPAAMARESALNAVIHSAQKRCACGDEDCGYDSDGMYQEPRIGSVSDLASTAGWEPVEYTVINEPWRQP